MKLATVGVDMASGRDLTAITIWRREPGGCLVVDHVFEFPVGAGQLVDAAMRQVRQVYPLGRRRTPPATYAAGDARA